MPEFPSQSENRRVWILDTIKENQAVVSELLSAADAGEFKTCAYLLDSMYKTERDALMLDEGIFTREQRQKLYELAE